MAGVSGSLTGDITVSPNSNIEDLSGTSLTSGMSGGELIVAGGEVTMPTKEGSKSSYTFNLGVGKGTLLEEHGFLTRTSVHEIFNSREKRDPKNSRNWTRSKRYRQQKRIVSNKKED